MSIKVNKTKQELEQSIRVRRDALQTLHQRLKDDSDAYQKWIMGISTLSGGIEVGKLSLGAESPLMDLTSIFFRINYNLISVINAFSRL